MPIVLAQPRLIDEGDNAVRLATYAQLMGFDECAFWGVFTGSASEGDCRVIQTLAQRTMYARYLAEAQEELEQILNYPLSPRWFGLDPIEQHPYKITVHARWAKLLAMGVRATTDISLGAAVNHAADPAVVGPLVTTVTDEAEIHVYHPGTDIEIDPSAVTIAAGTVTISIPRCRMVIEGDVDNPEAGLPYADTGATGPFEQTVDVKRVYNDDSTQATLVWPHQSSQCMCGCGSLCDEYTRDGCEYLRNPETGAIDVLPADYSSGAWNATCSLLNCAPTYVRLNYKAGLESLSKHLTEAIIRLAHVKMPKPPCGCGQLMEFYKQDIALYDQYIQQNNPELFTNWMADRLANRNRTLRMGVL